MLKCLLTLSDMDSITLLQTAESVMTKSAEMAENDPHGVIITVVSVAVVFASLIILYFAYTIIGKVANWKAKDRADEIAAAISLALHEHADGDSHDKESYVITIKRQHQTSNDRHE